MLTRQGCVLAEELHRSVEMLDRNMISQMKTLAKPPQVVVTVFNMVTLGLLWRGSGGVVDVSKI